MLGMATHPRQGFDPTDSLLDVAASFEALAALRQLQIEGLEAEPARDVAAITHLQKAREAALQGARLVEDADG